MRRLFLLIFYIGMSGSLFAQQVQTQRILSESGKLLGASHVQVNGSPYTVLFMDGSCVTIFQGCDPTRFAFRDLNSALSASTALRDQVETGPYAADPSQTYGCDTGPKVCNIWTPYHLKSSPGPGESALVQYSILNSDGVSTHFYTGSGEVPTWDTASVAGWTAVYAVWTAESSTAPSTATMDFNGDGTADILMRTTSGDISILMMNTSGSASTTNIGNVATDWHIMGSADFNSDGKSDILWRNINGDMVIWLMNGTAITQGIYIGNVSMDWTVTAIRDFNGDGKTDILWQNPDGVLVLWMMNGGTMTSSSYLGTLPGTKVQ